MTLIDLIKLGLLCSDTEAERFAEELVDRWHEDRVPGDLHDVLGLTPREYQAWTTGGVSLLTIARWHETSHPPLDPQKPWFKLSGRPGVERVGYLEQVRPRNNRTPKSRAQKTRRVKS
jgi:hypothetical protein